MGFFFFSSSAAAAAAATNAASAAACAVSAAARRAALRCSSTAAFFATSSAFSCFSFNIFAVSASASLAAISAAPLSTKVELEDSTGTVTLDDFLLTLGSLGIRTGIVYISSISSSSSSSSSSLYIVVVSTTTGGFTIGFRDRGCPPPPAGEVIPLDDFLAGFDFFFLLDELDDDGAVDVGLNTCTGRKQMITAVNTANTKPIEMSARGENSIFLTRRRFGARDYSSDCLGDFNQRFEFIARENSTKMTHEKENVEFIRNKRALYCC